MSLVMMRLQLKDQLVQHDALMVLLETVYEMMDERSDLRIDNCCYAQLYHEHEEEEASAVVVVVVVVYDDAMLII